MGKLSFKSLMSAFAVAFLVWCISCEVCNAREVTNRRSGTAAAATTDDSTAESSLWLWRGPWRTPYFPLPPFPYYRPGTDAPDTKSATSTNGKANPTATPNTPSQTGTATNTSSQTHTNASPTNATGITDTTGGANTSSFTNTSGITNTTGSANTTSITNTTGTKQVYCLQCASFGAKGDGNTDDTKAFQDAWAASCNEEASTMVVPANYVFLVGPISFVGEHCQENIILQLDGTVVAPTDPQAWGDDGIDRWLHFDKLSRFTLQGSGTVDGRGSVWWHRSQSEDLNDDLFDVDDDADVEMDYEDEDIQAKDELSSMPRNKPTAMRFDHCLNVTFSGIKIQNSPNFHLTFDHCTGVHVHDMSISSPGDSPNTDGIHLGNSQDVTIHDATLACGDDCISIVSGCSNIHIHDVHCGPGHGISIGSLGKDHSRACVHNITVQNVDLHGTTNGVRIKSWQGGTGTVYGVKFSNVRVSEVRWPIIIDQYYCDHTTCTNQSSAVAVQSIAYEKISGTYTERPVDLACSDSVPCEDITLSAIDLRPSSQKPPSHDDGPFCWQTFGQLNTPISPPIDCVQIRTRSSNGVGSGQDLC
ncbi:hypothetical protein NL676_030535 [Syzygium grande]|nr:hypothetical protein NL676_030535 [Syzygium grande]